MMGIKRVFFLAVMVFSLFVSVYSAAASTYVTVGDVGQDLLSAAVLPGGIDKIQGSLIGEYDASLYRFDWNGGDFFANTISSPTPQKDTQLFLFNSAGYGILANGDAEDGVIYSSLNLSNLAMGSYYLGVAFYNLEPVDSTGLPIFDYFGYPDFTAGPANGSGPLVGWGFQEGSYDNGAYVINISSTPVPIPGAIWLLGSGLIGIVGIRRKLKK